MMWTVRRIVFLTLAVAAAMWCLAVAAGAQAYTPTTAPGGETAGSGASNDAGALATTGSDSTFPWAGAGAGLIVAGGVLVMVARSRRQAHLVHTD